MGRVSGAAAILILFFRLAAAAAPPASPTTEETVRAAQAALAAQNYEQALKLYARALQRDEKNPSLWVGFGDAQNGRSAHDRDSINFARDCWERALTFDANYKPALE